MSQQTISAAEIQRMGGLSVYMHKAATEPAKVMKAPAQGRRSDIPASAYAERSPQGEVGAAAVPQGKAHAVAVPKEDEEQAEVIRWAKLREMCCPALALLFHIPNGGHRHKATAGRLFAQGVKPGVPDLFLPVPERPAPGRATGYHGLWIEMKRVKGGKVSPEQESWHARLRARGYRVEVCRGAAAAIAVLKDYLGMRHGG